MKTIAVAMILAASLACPATAHADCGDDRQTACTGPVPTVRQVVDLFQQLTDLDIPAANKSNIVTSGFAPDEAGTIDDRLYRMRAELPLNFVVTNIQHAPKNLAGATVSTGGYVRKIINPRPIVFVNQNGHWLITQHTAIPVLDAIWAASWK